MRLHPEENNNLALHGDSNGLDHERMLREL
jgi:hypothetical protein